MKAILFCPHVSYKTRYSPSFGFHPPETGCIHLSEDGFLREPPFKTHSELSSEQKVESEILAPFPVPVIRAHFPVEVCTILWEVVYSNIVEQSRDSTNSVFELTCQQNLDLVCSITYWFPEGGRVTTKAAKDIKYGWSILPSTLSSNIDFYCRPYEKLKDYYCLNFETKIYIWYLLQSGCQLKYCLVNQD